MSNLNTATLEAAKLFNTTDMVDELGLIKAQIAELEAKESAIKKALIATGRDKIPGVFYDVAISLSERESVDTKTLRADLGEEIIAQYLRKTDVTTVRVSAKK